MPCVYQITNPHGFTYIGSTMLTASERVNQHRAGFEMYHRTGAGDYSGAYDVLCFWPLVTIQVVEQYPDGSITREALQERERLRYDSEKYNSAVIVTNRTRPGRRRALSDARKKYLSEPQICKHCSACVSRRHMARHYKTRKCLYHIA